MAIEKQHTSPDTGLVGSYWRCSDVYIVNGGQIQCSFELYLDGTARFAGKRPFGGLVLSFPWDEKALADYDNPVQYAYAKIRAEEAFANAKDIFEDKAAEEIVQ